MHFLRFFIVLQQSNKQDTRVSDEFRMKHTITAIFIFLLFWTNSASCQDFLVARVLTVNPEALELTVVTATDPDTKIVVQIAAANDLPSSGGQTFLPECAAPDATIRLWGRREQTESPLFIATDIRGCGNEGCSDPTGIRSRLRKIRTHQESNTHEGEDKEGYRSGSGTHRGGGQGEGSGGGHGGGGGGGGGGNR